MMAIYHACSSDIGIKILSSVIRGSSNRQPNPMDIVTIKKVHGHARRGHESWGNGCGMVFNSPLRRKRQIGHDYGSD
jgi:hypothetical protein